LMAAATKSRRKKTVSAYPLLVEIATRAITIHDARLLSSSCHPPHYVVVGVRGRRNIGEEIWDSSTSAAFRHFSKRSAKTLARDAPRSKHPDHIDKQAGPEQQGVAA
jgi:hypothetical protein